MLPVLQEVFVLGQVWVLQTESVSVKGFHPGVSLCVSILAPQIDIPRVAGDYIPGSC